MFLKRKKKETEKKTKTECEEMEELRKKQEMNDQTVSDLRMKDTESHQKISEFLKSSQRKIRCSLLRLKKKNGGLTPDEEVELAEGC